MEKIYAVFQGQDGIHSMYKDEAGAQKVADELNSGHHPLPGGHRYHAVAFKIDDPDEMVSFLQKVRTK